MRRLIFPHPVGIIIASRSEIADGVVIYQNVTIGRRSFFKGDQNDYPIIEPNVIIYPGSVIAGEIIIGENTTIGPNCSITSNIPPNSTVTKSSVEIRERQSR